MITATDPGRSAASADEEAPWGSRFCGSAATCDCPTIRRCSRQWRRGMRCCPSSSATPACCPGPAREPTDWRRRSRRCRLTPAERWSCEPAIQPTSSPGWPRSPVPARCTSAVSPRPTDGAGTHGWGPRSRPTAAGWSRRGRPTPSGPAAFSTAAAVRTRCSPRSHARGANTGGPRPDSGPGTSPGRRCPPGGSPESTVTAGDAARRVAWFAVRPETRGRPRPSPGGGPSLRTTSRTTDRGATAPIWTPRAACPRR